MSRKKSPLYPYGRPKRDILETIEDNFGKIFVTIAAVAVLVFIAVVFVVIHFLLKVW